LASTDPIKKERAYSISGRLHRQGQICPRRELLRESPTTFKSWPVNCSSAGSQDQHFVTDLKESFWGDCQKQTQRAMERLLEQVSFAM
jgi:hypothetical protein